MADHLSIPYFVYVAHGGNQTGKVHTHLNRGLEVMGYLMFIADYYDCLPKVEALTKGLPPVLSLAKCVHS